ncbi:MAG TPA: DUF4249 family protein, partial [Chryseosolibacter sp.]|nr:DUF4249 family protein [Chryseosolibacter sp.]
MKACRTIWFTVFYLLGTSCEEVIDRPFENAGSSMVAVEAVMTNERIRHRVTLTKPFTSPNATPEPVTGALVTISAGGQSASLVEFPSGSGHYYTPELRAISGVTYRLTITYAGKTFIAEDRSVPVEPLPALEYRNTGEGFRLIHQPAGQDPNYISHNLYWGHVDGCTDPPSCRGEVY